MRWFSIFGLGILIGINVFMLSGVYFVFDQSMDRVARETIENWYQAEANNILEGNLLTSVSRNQKLLLSSEFLKGGVVFTSSGAKPEILMSFGAPTDLNLRAPTDVVQSTGLLRKFVTKKVSDQPEMTVGFLVFSKTVNDFFWLCAASLAFAVNGSLLLLAVGQRQEYLKRARQRSEFLEKAAQAVHDVQSPLMSLNHLVADKRLLPEVRRNLSLVAKNISTILNDLNENRRATADSILEASAPTGEQSLKVSSISKEFVAQIIDLKFQSADKRISYSMDDQTTDEFSVPLSQVTFSRCISNFIDNSIEAISDSGSIRAVLRSDENGSTVEIIDSGIGIPEEKLEQLGARGFTWGKTNGTGMGFHSAKKLIQAGGGEIKVKSQENVGTTVSVFFPNQSTATTVALTENEHLLLLDDDETVIATWKMLVERDLANSRDRVHYFSQPDQLLEFARNHPNKKMAAFCDFNLKSRMNGLDVAEQLRGNSRVYLLTGHSEDPAVRQRASALGVQIISKNSFDQIRIRAI